MFVGGFTGGVVGVAVGWAVGCGVGVGVGVISCLFTMTWIGGVVGVAATCNELLSTG